MKNKEIFKEFIFDLKYYYFVANDILFNNFAKEFEAIIPIIFDVVTFNKIKDDNKNLYKKLNQVVKDVSIKKNILIKHLLQRWRDLHFIEGRELYIIEISNDNNSL